MYETQFLDHLTPSDDSGPPSPALTLGAGRSQSAVELPELVPALFASVFVPGVGQAMQTRTVMALVMFTLLGLSGFIFYHFGIQGFFFHALLVLYASLDVALWNYANPEPPQEVPKSAANEVKAFHGVFGFVLCFTLLVYLFVPAVSAAKEAARRMQCVSNYKQLTVVLYNYHEAHGSLPPAYTVDADGKPLHSWRVLVLPYYEQKELYDKIRLDEPWDSEHNRQFHGVHIGSYSSYLRCPSAPTRNPLYKMFPNLEKPGMCDISVVIGEQTLFPGSKAVSFADMKDSRSDTIMLVERMTPICWMDPNQEIQYETAVLGINKDLNGIGGFHSPSVRCTIAVADGSIHMFPDDFPLEIFQAMLTHSGGEKIRDWDEHLKR